MSLTMLLLLITAGALIIPSLGGDDDDDDDNKNEIDGTFEADSLEGTDGNDLIRGLLGDDTINGGAGNDEILGGEGMDTIDGGLGLDFVRGGPGDDTINGGEGNDRLISDRGDDRVDGGFGSDVIRGGAGDDTILGGQDARLQDDGSLRPNGEATDVLSGQGGSDTVYIWGGDGLANGGLNEGADDEKDEVILVTGNAQLGDDQGTTDFYALANIEDDQETFATITEFDRTEHRMILTVDIDLTGETDTPEIDFTVTQTVVGGVNGVLVEAVLVNNTDFDADTFETSSAFFRGAVLPDGLTDEEIKDYFDIQVVETNAVTNDYTDPETTVAAIKALIPANPAVT